MNYQELHGITIREGFNKFNFENPQIYQAFEEQALKAIKRGRDKISAKLIINWIRWNEVLSSSDMNFKIDDAYQSYYARLFVEKHPEHSDAFNFRKLRNEEAGEFMVISGNKKVNFL